MDSTQQTKEWARAVKEAASRRLPWMKLAHGQALEMVVALTSRTSSWNAFSAGAVAPCLPVSVEDYFGAVARGQRRLRDLEVAPSSTRSRRSYASMTLLGAIAGSPLHPYRLPWDLMTAAGTPVPNVLGYTTAQLESDPEQFMELRLASWFFRQHVGLDREAGKYPWDDIERMAKSMGFTDADAGLIREIQREAPNHCWRLYSWLEVGVLDPDQEQFLRELQLESNWRERFSELLRTDDGRAPYSA